MPRFPLKTVFPGKNRLSRSKLKNIALHFKTSHDSHSKSMFQVLREAIFETKNS